MNDVQVLVDFENVQPSLDDLARLAPGLTSLWLFHGPHQIKLAQQFKAEHEHVTLVPISKTGKNALDFHLSFYLGYVAARHPDARLVVVANDKGYDPMILHARTLGFDALRVDTKAKVLRAAPKPKATTKATPKAKSKVIPKAAPKATVPAKSVAPARKAPSAKALAKPAVEAATGPVAARKAAKQQPPAKKPVEAKLAPAKATSAKVPSKVPSKVPAKAAAKVTAKVPAKAAEKKAPRKSADPKPKADSVTTAATLARVSAGLAKMGGRRPEKLKSLLRHLASMLGKDAGADEVQDLVHRLAQAGVIRVSVDGVSYRDG